MLAPLSESRWNFEAAAHLLNRAGFGGTPQAIEALRARGLRGAVDSLVDYEALPRLPLPEGNEWSEPDPGLEEYAAKVRAAKDDEERRALFQERGRLMSRRGFEARIHWLDRMLRTERPLEEKLTLFWHGHFATSIVKVKDPYFMWRQNELFRRLAQGPWGELLFEASRDPAMLIWLDGSQSRPKKPNENFAREILELFALGEGHYTEEDIRAAAKAFVGWTVDNTSQSFIDHPEMYNTEPVKFLGEERVWRGAEVVQRLASDPRSLQYLVERMWRFFVNEFPEESVVKHLAGVLAKSGGQFKPMLKELFASEFFYSAKVVRQQVKSPVQWLIGLCHCLEMPLPAPVVCQQALAQLGQELLAPPSVKGWDGGISWISTSYLLNRYNFAAALINGSSGVKLQPPRSPTAEGNKERAERLEARFKQSLKPAPIMGLFPEEAWQSAESLLAAVERRFVHSRIKPERREVLATHLASQRKLDEAAARSTIQLLAATPEFQLT